MRCERCNAQIGEGMAFCPGCGLPVTESRNLQYDYRHDDMQNNYGRRNFSNRDYYGGNQRNQSNTANVLVIFVVIVALLLSVWGGVVAFTLINSNIKQENLPKNTVIIHEQPANKNGEDKPVVKKTETEPEKETEVVYTQPEKVVSYYDTPSVYYTYPHIKLEDNFSCKFPSNFSVYTDGKDTQYTVRSGDGASRQLIDVEPIYGTTKEVMDAYIGNNGGSALYRDWGNNYFLVQMVNGSTGYYKYGKKVGNKLYSVELIYPDELRADFTRVMNDVRASFNY